MPKIRDLGINVIPETARPPEIGGGGCGFTCTPSPQCTPSPANPTDICYWGCTPTPQCTPSPGNLTDNCYWGAYPQTPPCTPSPGTNPTEACYYRTPNCTPSPGGTNPTGDCHPRPGGLTLEACNQLKQQLQRQIEQLDEIAKDLGPKTAEAIDAREAELKKELEELARRRRELKK